MNTAEYTRLRNLLAGVAVAMAATVLLIWADGRAQTDRILDQRAQARLATCRNANHTRAEAIEAGRNKAKDLIAAIHHVPIEKFDTINLTPEEASYIESQAAATAAAYPLLDCSAKGIEVYYENPPPAVDDNCVPDGKGFCK